MHTTRIHLNVNNSDHQITTWPMRRLLDVLRQDLRLTGTKEGCGEGECGACAVLVDGELVNSCLVPVQQVDGAHVTTVEGLSRGGQLCRLQQSFAQNGGTQCGICTPGMLMAALNLLHHNPHPSAAEIRKGLAGNLCRCTGYMQIVKSVINAIDPHRKITA